MKEETGFWLFNCNPAIWDIKSKLETDETNEDWRIPKNRIHQFKKGQLGIIRVAIDTRSKKLVKTKLKSGVYAIVEVADETFYGQTKHPELFLDEKKLVRQNHNRVPIRITDNLLEQPILISDLKTSDFKYDKVVYNPGQGIDVAPLSRNSFFEIIKHIGRIEKTWSEDIITALQNLGGEAHLTNIYKELERIRKKFNPTWHGTVREALQDFSSDSTQWKKTKKNKDLFYNKFPGTKSGIWGLRGFKLNLQSKNDYEAKLHNEVQKNLNLSLSDLKNKAGKNKNPKRKKLTTENFTRDAYVVAYVLKLSKGKCELCLKNAPFKKKKTNEPYLECHHVKWLSKGGQDIIENAVALCPNCHRKMHSLRLKKDIDKLNSRINLRT